MATNTAHFERYENTELFFLVPFVWPAPSPVSDIGLYTTR